MNLLLESLVPLDADEEETENKIQIRTKMSEVYNCNMEQLFTSKELNDALW